MGRPRCDVLVIGGGIVGMATARALKLMERGLDVTVVEKESQLARHQSGHNSGVIHSGLYYAPGSLKARFCVEGNARMVAFCAEHDVAFRQRGKVVVAVEESELSALEELHRRGVRNGVRGLRRIGPGELREVEPHAAGIAALRVDSTGVVDYREVVAAMAREFKDLGGVVRTGERLVAGRYEGNRVEVETTRRRDSARVVVNCAGLHCDQVARVLGVKPQVQIVPFRGEYYHLRDEVAGLVRTAIYPVPDPRFPFLGVHFTRGVDDRVEAGPNAVLAWSREGYNWRTISPSDIGAALRYRGFRRMVRRSWRQALGEYRRSLSRRAFVTSLRRLVPELPWDAVEPAGAGVRAQAVDREGNLVNDFCIQVEQGVVSVLNAPSPAATCSLLIGEHVADQVKKLLGL